MKKPSTAAIKPATTRHGLIWLLATLITLSAGISWLLASTSGLNFLISTMARNVTLSEVNGSLLGPVSAKTLIISQPDLRITAHDIRLDWRPAALLKGELEITMLAAHDVSVLSLPSPYPDNLRLPLAISVNKLNIDTVQIFSKQDGTADFSAQKLTASFSSDGRLHRLQDLNANSNYGQLTASGQIDGNRPFTVNALAELAGLTDFTGLAGHEARISASVSGNLLKLVINAKGSGAGLSGKADIALTPYARFPVATLKAAIAGLNPQAFSLNAPNANLALQADLLSNATGALEGNVSAANLSPGPWDRDSLPVQEIRAHATLTHELVKLDDMTLSLAKNASITGNLSWQQTSGSADLIIRQLDPATLDTRLRAARLNGSIKLSGDSKAQLGVLSLSDGTLHLDAHLTKADNTVTLDNLILARAQASLTGNGHLQLDKNQAYQFNGRLHRFDLASFMRAPHSDLNATLELAGNLAPKPVGTLNFTMNNSYLSGQAVRGNGKIEFAKLCINRIDSELRLGDNQLRATGGLCEKTLQVDLAAPALQQLGADFGGSLNAHASLAGTPAQPEVSFTVDGHSLLLPGEHQLGRFEATGGLHGEALNLSVSASNYRRHTKTAPVTTLTSELDSLQLNVQGSRTHHELQMRINQDKNNALILTAKGGFPDMAQRPTNWQGSLTELTGSGSLPFKLLSNAPLSLNPNHLMLGTTEMTIAGGELHINGVDWTPQRLRSKGHFTGIGIRSGLQSAPPADVLRPGDVLRLGGDWELDSAIQGNLHIRRESGDWARAGEQPLGLRTLEVTARAASGRLTGELTAQGTRLGEWHARISSPFVKSAIGFSIPDKAPLTGHISINISDLAWLGPMISNNLKTDGKLALDADITGSYTAPGLLGQVRGDDLAIALLNEGVRLQKGQLMAHFNQKTLRIDTLNFIAPHNPKPKDSLLLGFRPDTEAGELRVSGSLDLDGKGGNIDIIARHLPLAMRADRWIIASGNGHLSLNHNQLTLGGTLTADVGLISQSESGRPQLSDDVVITGRQTPARTGPSLVVDATLDLGEHFYLRAAGLEARLAGQLIVRDARGLNVTGSIAARNANFEAYGQKLTVQRGIVNFHGPLYDPGLNILAVRQGLSVEAGVTVTGSALHPVVKLVSTPDVSDVEKLSWIVLGRAPSSTGSDSSLLLSAAGGILGGGAGGISGQLKQALGVDELSLGQNVSASAVNDNPLSSQIVTVGKRLSSRAFISYSQGVTAVAGITKLSYTLTPRVSIVTQAGMDNAIDIFYTFSFN